MLWNLLPTSPLRSLSPWPHLLQAAGIQLGFVNDFDGNLEVKEGGKGQGISTWITWAIPSGQESGPQDLCTCCSHRVQSCPYFYKALLPILQWGLDGAAPGARVNV